MIIRGRTKASYQYKKYPTSLVDSRTYLDKTSKWFLSVLYENDWYVIGRFPDVGYKLGEHLYGQWYFMELNGKKVKTSATSLNISVPISEREMEAYGLI